MNRDIKVLLVNDIKLSVNASLQEAFSLAEKRLNKLALKADNVKFSVFRKSVDARKKSEIKFVYTIRAEGAFPNLSVRALDEASVSVLNEETDPYFMYGEEKLLAPPLVVGTGPCGLFASLLLAESGYKPIVIERGADIPERIGAARNFSENCVFDSETNIQFGAGGAGTFSDGKLVTRINDPLTAYVLNRFVEFGAPKEILYLAKPHVGTDVLSQIVQNILSRIEELGGRVMYHTKLLNFKKSQDSMIAVTNKGDISCSVILLAVGHSARDTYSMLMQKGFVIEPKAFSVGMRIEHFASNIDRSMYGDFAGHPALGHAEYNLSYNTKERGVYTFCMCPGGEVVAAASEEDRLVVNGMSYHARNGANANAAVAVSIHCEDVEPVDGNLALGMIAFQRKLERAAFLAGAGDYYAPIMTMGDFMNGTKGSEPTKVLPSYRDGRVRCADFDSIFPSFVTDGLRYGFASFGKKLKGYDAPETVLTAVETRTSAPVRILRNEESLLALGFDRIYPCGEGAGYAGGITSAAVDGIRIAMALMKRFAPFER